MEKHPTSYQPFVLIPDVDLLRTEHDRLKEENEHLQAENERLRAELERYHKIDPVYPAA